MHDVVFVMEERLSLSGEVMGDPCARPSASAMSTLQPQRGEQGDR